MAAHPRSLRARATAGCQFAEGGTFGFYAAMH